ncbi:MAG: fluoride efflux transporter CrcB [SAR202 cluster bacterium]|nr:fluoride efflux transporter CrcB [SAR202 cluster bacterium]
MLKVLLIGAGGFLGAIARYGMSGWVQALLGSPGYPYGTLAVNVAGCLGIGVVAGVVQTRDVLSIEARSFLSIGILGGFTTFSAFGNETIAFLRDGRVAVAAGYIALQVGLGLFGVWLGHTIAQAGS